MVFFFCYSRYLTFFFFSVVDEILGIIYFLIYRGVLGTVIKTTVYSV